MIVCVPVWGGGGVRPQRTPPAASPTARDSTDPSLGPAASVGGACPLLALRFPPRVVLPWGPCAVIHPEASHAIHERRSVSGAAPGAFPALQRLEGLRRLP